VTPRIGSLFSGGGGLDLAVESAFGAEVAWHCELDTAASKVLAARWPDVLNLGDITQVAFGPTRGHAVDILCGGFPCQDVSAAGRRAGIKDGTRSGLWAVFADAIAALRPPIVIVENVRGLLSAEAHRAVESADATLGDGPGRPVLRAAGAVLGDLADLGYDAQWATVAAADVGAPHRRERVFIIATDTSGDGWPRLNGCACGEATRSGRKRLACGSNGRAATSDTASDGRHEGRPESARIIGGSDAAVSGDGPVELLPTPLARDSRTTSPGDYNRHTPSLAAIDHYLPTPAASDCTGGGAHPDSREGHSRQLIDFALLHGSTQWGKYEPAIRRWETLTRPAPSPTEPNRNGNPRLSAAFSEWMMGWPAGWVTDVEGISRNDQLRVIGNGVCVQQCVAALRQLLAVSEMVA
jgi:DNA (cytosine-5)-methyltransferase 1